MENTLATRERKDICYSMVMCMNLLNDNTSCTDMSRRCVLS